MGKSFGFSRAAQISLPYILIDEQDRQQEELKAYERKCYDDGELIYEGEGYNLNDRFYRHGQGKAYRKNGSLEYEGKFYHDEACGRGVCYWENGTVMYEGELWHGKWFGLGRSYCDNGMLQTEGTFVEGIATGKARVYKKKGQLYFEGTLKNGKGNGKCRTYDENTGNLYYEGDYVDNEVHGWGRLYYDDETLRYEGEFKHSQYDGYGREYSEDGTLVYEGLFADGERVPKAEKREKKEKISGFDNDLAKLLEKKRCVKKKEDNPFADWFQEDEDDLGQFVMEGNENWDEEEDEDLEI